MHSPDKRNSRARYVCANVKVSDDLGFNVTSVHLSHKVEERRWEIMARCDETLNVILYLQDV